MGLKQLICSGFLIATCVSTHATAANVSTAIGVTGQGDMTYRVGLGFDWGQQWLESSTGHVTGYWDLGYTYWEGGDKGSGEHSLSFAPVFVYEFAGGYVKPFVEIGVGVSAFSATRVGDKDLGSSFNFEDRLGAGVKIADAHRVGVRVIHYSNAGIKEPNDGIESYSLFYSLAF